MATYYVKNGGSDGAAGTSDGTAWETVDKARTTVTGSDVVYFKRGDEFDRPNSMWGMPGGCTVGAYGSGPRPILNATNARTGWVVDSGNVYKLTSITQGTDVDEMLWENGVAMTRVTSQPTSAGEFWLDDASDELLFWATDDADPDTHDIRFSEGGDFYRIDDNSGTVLDIEFRYGGTGNALMTGEFSVSQTGWGVDNCIFRHGRSHGFQQFGAIGSDYIFDNCLFTQFVRSGITFDNNPVDTIVDGCEFSYIQGYSTSTGISTDGTSGCIIRNSSAHHCQSDGFGLRSDSVGIIVERCVGYNNGVGQDDRAGFTNFGTDNTIRYNAAYGNGTDTAEQQGTGFQNDFGHETALLHHNLAYANQSAAFACADGGDGASAGSEFYFNVGYDNGRAGAAFGAYGIACYGTGVDGLVLKNNIFMDNHLAAGSSWTVHENGTAIVNASPAVVMDNNIHYNSNSHTYIIKWNGQHATLAAFVAAEDGGDNGVEADPLMVDPDNQRFDLKRGSPAIDAGVAIGGLTTDFLGRPIPDVGWGVDIGAYERQHGVCSITGG